MTASVPTGFQKGFPYLLLPTFLGTANRAKRREKGDLIRSVVFGAIAVGVGFTLFAVSFWLAWQLTDYEELGEYLLRLGLSWLFLTFLSFLAFSALVTSLSTFFLSDDLKLLLAAPIPQTRLFYSRYARALIQLSWMVLAFLTPVLLGIGLARCVPWCSLTPPAEKPGLKPPRVPQPQMGHHAPPAAPWRQCDRANTSTIIREYRRSNNEHPRLSTRSRAPPHPRATPMKTRPAPPGGIHGPIG